MTSAFTLSLPLALVALAAGAEPPNVVTDIPPVHSLVAKVMGDLGTPELLVSGGAEPHSYQLRPSQAAALANADLIFWVGHEMTPWLERALEGGDGATAVALLDLPTTKIRVYEEAHEGEAHEGEAGHDDHAQEGHEEEGHAEEGHGHSGADPHAWLDPRNARAWIVAIRDGLSASDAANAPSYAANADKALADLAALETAIEGKLAGAKAAPIITSHDAYGYFSDRFGLSVAGSMEAGDAADPGAGHVSALAALAASKGVRCLFPEAGHDPARMSVLASDTGLKLGGALDPEGVMIEPGSGLYDRLLTQMAEAIAACNAS